MSTGVLDRLSGLKSRENAVRWRIRTSTNARWIYTQQLLIRSGRRAVWPVRYVPISVIDSGFLRVAGSAGTHPPRLPGRRSQDRAHLSGRRRHPVGGRRGPSDRPRRRADRTARPRQPHRRLRRREDLRRGGGARPRRPSRRAGRGGGRAALGPVGQRGRRPGPVERQRHRRSGTPGRVRGSCGALQAAQGPSSGAGRSCGRRPARPTTGGRAGSPPNTPGVQGLGECEFVTRAAVAGRERQPRTPSVGSAGGDTARTRGAGRAAGDPP